MGRVEGDSCGSYYIYNVFIGYSFHRFFFFIGLRGVIGYILAARITHGI